MKKDIDIKELWQKLSRAFRGVGSDADKDWKIVFSVFLFGFLCVVVFGAMLFFEVQGKKEDVSSSSLSSKELVNNAALTKLLSSYEARGQDYEKTLASTNLIDPAR